MSRGQGNLIIFLILVSIFFLGMDVYINEMDLKTKKVTGESDRMRKAAAIKTAEKIKQYMILKEKTFNAIDQKFRAKAFAEGSGITPNEQLFLAEMAIMNQLKLIVDQNNKILELLSTGSRERGGDR